MPELKKYNFGCGQKINQLKGYVNIDIDKDMEPDLVIDLTKPPYPIEENSGSQILFMHTIEHIDKWYHFNIFLELQRILNDKGTIYVAFPEFEKVAANWISNYKGNREYWEACIYGRAMNSFDRHVAAMRSIEVQEMMMETGFCNIKITPEPKADFNTLISANKGKRLPTYEEHITKTVLGQEMELEKFES